MKQIEISEVLIDFVKNTSNVPGWEIHKQGATTVLVTPTTSPRLNLLLDAKNRDDLEFAVKIFKNKGFGVIHEQPLEIPKTHIATASVEVTEMYKDLRQSFEYREISDVEYVTSEERLRVWAEFLKTIEDIDVDSILTYLSPYLHRDNQEIYMICQNGAPIATGQVFIGENKIALISAIAVKESHRRQGLGTKIMTHILARAQTKGAKFAGLYASEMGAYLYKNENFHTSHDELFTIVEPKMSLEKA